MSHKLFKKIAIIASVTTTLTLTANVVAQDYNPYPGKLSAQVIDVISVSTINVEAETWPGYSKAIRVSLANAQVPQSTSEIICERELAGQALDFTKGLLATGTEITISDLTMANSSSPVATALIHTKQGSLFDMLKSHGFARSADNTTEEPWC